MPFVAIFLRGHRSGQSRDERVQIEAFRRDKGLRRVMIVDDSVSIRLTVSFTLRHGGYEVIEAEDGHDAIKKLATETVDLIITDLNMPVVDGIALIRKIREIPEMKTKPVLMLTTEGHPSKKEEGKAAGATGWIVKPIDPEKLLRTLAKVLP